MIRVVIVEDELLVRLGIKMCLEQEGGALCVAGAFGTAQEALAFFERESADVLITDIRLPGMSGLELIESLGMGHEGMTRIVLSCLENFDYAREAYELGVDKYILKHELRDEELPGMVLKLHHAKSANRARPNAGTKPIEAPASDDGAAGWRALCGVSLVPCGDFVGKNELNLTMIAGLFAELPGAVRVSRHLAHGALQLAFLLHFPVEMDEAAILAEQRRLYQDARATLANYVSHHLFMLVSTPFRAPEGEHDAESQLQRALPAAFYCEAPQLCMAHELPAFQENCAPIEYPLGELLSGAEGLAAFGRELDRFFTQCRADWIHPDAVRVQTAAFLHALNSFLKKDHGCALEEVNQGPYPANYLGVARIAGYREMCAWLKQLAGCAQRHVVALREKQSPMNGILERLQRDYAQEITQESIANEFFISPTYLSFLFRKKTGTTFTRYLGQLRVRRAMELLRDSDMSIEQIAHETGFQNVNYFFRLFKKLAGCTAGEYRRRKIGNVSKDGE